MQSIDSLRELNAKLLAEIAKLKKENDKISELEKKFAEVEAENAKLKQIIEENAMRDARVKELEQKNTELETRLAIVDRLPWLWMVRHRMVRYVKKIHSLTIQGICEYYFFLVDYYSDQNHSYLLLTVIS